MNLRFTPFVHEDRAAEEIDQLYDFRQSFRRRWSVVATESELSFSALHLFDEPSIDIVLIGAVAQLAEEKSMRIRRLESRDAEDAGIDCRQSNKRFLPLRIRRSDLDPDRSFRTDFRRRVERNVQPAFAALERQMNNTQSAGRRDQITGVTGP